MNDGLIVPVFFGSALNGFGVGRLLKALRHETPPAARAAERVGIEAGSYVLRAAYAGQSGKLAYARAFGKPLADGADFVLPDGERCRAGRAQPGAGRIAEEGRHGRRRRHRRDRQGGGRRRRPHPLHHRPAPEREGRVAGPQAAVRRGAGGPQPQGRRAALRRARQADRGGPGPDAHPRSGGPPDAAGRPGRGPCAAGAGTDEAPVRRGDRHRRSEDPLPRDHPEGHDHPGPPQEAVRRPRPVRRRDRRDPAPAPRFGLRLHPARGRRRGAQAVDSRRRAGRPRRAREGAVGLPGHRPGGHPDRRPDPQRRLFRNGLPHCRPAGDRGRPRRLRRHPAGAHREADGLFALAQRLERHLGPDRPAGPDPGARAPRGLARLGADRGLPAAERAPAPDRRDPRPDPGAGRLRSRLRPHGRTHRPAGGRSGAGRRGPRTRASASRPPSRRRAGPGPGSAGPAPRRARGGRG